MHDALPSPTPKTRNLPEADKPARQLREAMGNLAPTGNWVADWARVDQRVIPQALLMVKNGRAALTIEANLLPLPVAAREFACVVEAGGWRWRFRGQVGALSSPGARPDSVPALATIQSTGELIVHRIQVPTD